MTTLSPPDPVPNLCPFKLWCCGNLRTATISVGLTNIVSLLLLTCYYIGTTLYRESFSLSMLVVAIIVMLLIFTNLGLIYGATKKYKWLFIPWMVIYLPAILSLLIFCSIKFSSLEGKQLAAIILIIISTYFYAIVVTSYIELKLTENLENEVESLEGKVIDSAKTSQSPTVTEPTKKSGEECLIDLTELENMNSTVDENGASAKPDGADETFSTLAVRTSTTTTVDGNDSRRYEKSAFCSLDDSGEFTVPHEADPNNSNDFNFTSHFSGQNSGLLPVPEEVIPIEKLVEKIEAEMESRKIVPEEPKNETELQTQPDFGNRDADKDEDETSTLLTASHTIFFKDSTSVPGKRMARASKSLVHVDRDHANGLLAAKSESKIPADRKLINVDASFSPFRPADTRNGSDPLNLPKMKIFLPKNSESSDDASSSDEEMEKSSLTDV